MNIPSQDVIFTLSIHSFHLIKFPLAEDVWDDVLSALKVARLKTCLECDRWKVSYKK